MTPNTDRRSRSSSTPSTDSSTDEEPDLSQSDIFHILQTSRRRDVIDYLLDKEGQIKMGDIAEHVAAKEHETTVAELTSTQRQRVYIPLYQSHLPTLDENGIIEYDKPRGIVQPTDRLEVFRPYLEAANGTDGDDRSETDSDPSLSTRLFGDYYLTALSASAGLIAASMIGLVLFSELALAAIITTLFALATVATTLSDSRPSTDSGGSRPIR